MLFGEDADVVNDRAFRLLLLVNLSPPLGTSLLSPLLDTLTHTYAVPEASIGLLMTVYTAPSILIIPLVGALSDRVGRKPPLLVGLLLFGLGGVGLAFTTDFRVALGLRFVQGVGFSALTPVLVTSIGDIFSAGREATAQGVRFSTSGLTLMTLPPLAGVLVAVAWNLPFLLYLLPFPAALAVWRYLEEPSDPGEGARVAGGQTRALLAHLRQPRIAAVLVGRSVPNFLFLTLYTYNSFIVVRAIRGSPGEAGLLVAATSLAQAATATQAGRITARFETRFWPLAGGTAMMGVGLAVVGLAPTLPVLFAGGAVIGAGFGISLSLYRSVITGFSTTLRGGLVSTGSALGRVTATAAPIVVGAAVATLRASAGFVGAVRWAIVAAAVTGTVVGMGSLLVAKLSPPVDPETGRALAERA